MSQVDRYNFNWEEFIKTYDKFEHVYTFKGRKNGVLKKIYENKDEDLKKRPCVYIMIVNNEIKYIGKSDKNLASRIGWYRSGTQLTNKKIRDQICDNELTVEIHVYVPESEEPPNDPFFEMIGLKSIPFPGPFYIEKKLLEMFNPRPCWNRRKKKDD